MIRFGNSSDKTELKKLWQSTFLEDEAVTERFFNSIWNDTITPVYCVDEKIVSSLFLLPCKIGKYIGKCIYCAQTAFTHRGKGYMKELLDFSYEYIKNENLDFLFLVPAESSLFDYYEKCGFEKFGIHRVFENKGEIPQTEPFLYDCELSFEDNIVEYWQNSCICYGGKIESYGLVFEDEQTIIRNAWGDFENFKDYENALIQGKMSFGEAKFPAMIKTENENIKNIRCYIGITLE